LYIIPQILVIMCINAAGTNCCITCVLNILLNRTRYLKRSTTYRPVAAQMINGATYKVENLVLAVHLWWTTVRWCSQGMADVKLSLKILISAMQSNSWLFIFKLLFRMELEFCRFHFVYRHSFNSWPSKTTPSSHHLSYWDCL